MSLKQTIETELKNAMRVGDETRKTALRSIIAGIKLAEVEQRGTPLEDSTVLGIIQKEIKSQRESIADAQKASRADLVAQSESLIAIYESFLPKQLSRDEVIVHVQAAIAEVNANNPGDMGKVMKVIQPKLKGLADNKLISDVVKELLTKK
ncbi:MAG: GatB/YqeY domain-containing protein [Chloroflexi bacterium]|nr:GatB/YqeY domain-containing protein [Chloroflexota bacterium]MBI5082136.1 GatB/YqeY domain-containing protein [Chloroflexota bacterium]MBI5348260.1 GatB/YqeY domain-containing protein [Chloroflexota bacterium]MBI5715044.1 GatB/YqeY domain-containing protein [Chloroflexota bacterium]